MPRFDFSAFFLNATLSDVVVAVRARDAATGAVLVEELPSHGIVLANVSPLFKLQIEQQAGSEQHTLGNPAVISLDCTTEQVPAARALIKYIYQGLLPDSNSPQQPQLVHMLHLSHKYAVGDCTRSCLAALMAVPQLQLDTVHLVLSLLPADATASAPAAAAAASSGRATDFRPLIKHALNHLQQQLGDLEATLSSPALLLSFRKLPHSALLGLLQDERTSAASENTVLAAVQGWLVHQAAPLAAAQLQQLAAAIRVPLLEPAFLTTVLPRVPWLLDVLGPHGLAMAAGAARGLCDPHAEPCLSNPRACGVLAEWGRGPRPLPASCSGADGPEATLCWRLPLEDIRRAFEEACAAAAAAGNTFEAAAAIGSRVASPVPPCNLPAAVAGISGAADAAGARATATAAEAADDTAAPRQLLRTSSSMAAAALSAAAGAVSYGASMFRKRGRSPDTDEQDIRDQQQRQQQQWHIWGSRAAAAPGSSEAAGVTRQPEKAAQHGSRKRQCTGHAGTGWEEPDVPGGLARQQQQVEASEPASAAAAGARADVAAAAAPDQQQCRPQPWKLRSPEVTFAGYNWRLVLYFQASEQPQQQQQGRQQQRTAGGSSSQQATPPAARRSGRRSSQAAAAGGGGGGGAASRQEVAAAAALNLPEEPQQRSWTWQARLALEACPCMVLQPGVSVVAFSGSLAVKLNGDVFQVAQGGRDRRQTAGAGAEPSGLPGRHLQQQQRRHGMSAAEALAAVAAAGGRVPAGHGLASGAAAGAVGGGVRAPRSSSNMLAAQHAGVGDEPAGYEGLAAAAAAGTGGAVPRSPVSRRAAAVAAAAKIVQQQSGLMCPDSEADEEEEEEGEGAAGVEEDDDVLLVEEDEGEGAEDDAAEAFGSPGGAAGCGSVLCSSGSAAGSDDDEADEAAAAAAATARARQGGRQQQSGSGRWQVFTLPQGSWVKSRKCDTGFRDFFGISLVHGQWDEAAWERYLQLGGLLELKARIWSVR